MQDKLIEAEIDDGILGVVLVLNDAGVKTFSSCQGGGYGWGHGYLRPIVCFDGDDSEGERAEKIATDAGYQVFQVQRVWYTRDGERVGPFWEMEFVAGAACRAPKDRAAVRAHDAAKKSAILSDGEDGWILAEFPSMPGCMSQGKGDSDALRNLADAIDAVNAVKAHAAESAPQLDAEDPAEPVEDVPPGYVKLEDVEKAIRAVWKEHYHSQAVWSKEEFLSKLMARLAPKPEPSQSAVIDTLRSEDFQRANACIECGAIVVHQELHAKWHAALVERRTK